VFCTSSGDVFTCGEGAGGCLGHGGHNSEAVPRLVQALVGRKAVAVAAGSWHTAVIVDEGELFTFGECGNLDGLTDLTEPEILFPTRVEALCGKKVVAVAAGFEHIVVHTDIGEVYSWGSGSFGCLGHGSYDSEISPRLIAGLKGIQVVGMAAGSRHTAVLTDKGEIFTFGEGKGGCLGHGNEETELLPRLVEGLTASKIVAVATGHGHTVVCSESGEVFTAGGWENHSCLGHASNQNELLFRRVDALSGKKVVEVAAGYAHTVVCTDAFEVLTFGDGASGRLGHGGENDEALPTMITTIY